MAKKDGTRLATSYEQKDYDYVTEMGTLGAGESKEQYQSTDGFLLAQAQWLDNYLTTRQTNPTWTVTNILRIGSNSYRTQL